MEELTMIHRVCTSSTVNFFQMKIQTQIQFSQDDVRMRVAGNSLQVQTMSAQFI